MKNRYLLVLTGAIICASLLGGCMSPQSPALHSSPVVQQLPVSQTIAVQPSPVLQNPQVKQTTAAPGQKPSSSQQVSANSRGKSVDLVICLDTSNSMDGLINSARQKLWDIVNEVNTLKPRPVLRVALLSYGNSHYDSRQGWVRIDTDFTSDLDSVSEKLFGLRTSGGTELVARAVSDSLNRLSWNEGKDALRIIFVAGNESAHQDRAISIHSICNEARQKDIVVNAIFCGNATHGEQLGWNQVASCGGGDYFAIDQQKGTMVVKTPFDQKLADLSGELNSTYVAYGAQGREKLECQSVQDSNAKGMSGYAAANRACAKSSELYNNRGWDLVDACKDKDFKLESVKKQDLPASMQAMNEKEQQDYVNKMKEKRESINRQIRELSSQREDYIRKAQKQPGSKDSFDAAMRQALSAQALKKGFQK